MYGLVDAADKPPNFCCDDTQQDIQIIRIRDHVSEESVNLELGEESNYKARVLSWPTITFDIC